MALDMKVVATRVGGTGKPDFVSYVGQPDELLKLARTADVIISAVPLTPETTDLYNKEFFAVLKPTAFFINIARGGSVDTDALMAALNEGAPGWRRTRCHRPGAAAAQATRCGNHPGS